VLPNQKETFISADDLRVNLWHLGTNDQSFNIVDIKPANMEDLTEVGAAVLSGLLVKVCGPHYASGRTVHVVLEPVAACW
jgi:hypothetical protein